MEPFHDTAQLSCMHLTAMSLAVRFLAVLPWSESSTAHNGLPEEQAESTGYHELFISRLIYIRNRLRV